MQKEVVEALGEYLAAWSVLVIKGDLLCDALEANGQDAPREALDIYREMQYPWQRMYLALLESEDE